MVTGADPGSERSLVVLIPVRNDLAGLRESMASVLASEGEPHLVVVDDASDVPVLLDGMPGDRVTLLRCDRHLGVAGALNRGLEHVLSRTAYRYVARLDAGDTVHRERFVRQRRRLDAEPELGIVGSWVEFVVPEAPQEGYVQAPPSSHSDIRRAMRLRNVLIHPAVTMRLDILRTVGLYSLDYEACEDYELFLRILKRAQGCNIPEILTRCAQRRSGVSRQRRRQQLRSKLRIQLTHFAPTAGAMLGIAATIAGLLLPYRLFVNARRLRLLRAFTFVQ